MAGNNRGNRPRLHPERSALRLLRPIIIMTTLTRWFERIPQALGWHELLCKCSIHDYEEDDHGDERCKDCGEYDVWADFE